MFLGTEPHSDSPLSPREQEDFRAGHSGRGAAPASPIFPPRASAHPMTPPGLPLCWHCSPSTVSFASLVQMSSKARPRHPPSCHYLVPLYSEYCSHQLGGHYFPGNSLCPGWFQPLLPGLSYHSGRVCTPPPSLHTRGPRVTPFVTWSPSPARADCVIWVQLARPPSASVSSSGQRDKCRPHPPGRRQSHLDETVRPEHPGLTPVHTAGAQLGPYLSLPGLRPGTPTSPRSGDPKSKIRAPHDRVLLGPCPPAAPPPCVPLDRQLSPSPCEDTGPITGPHPRDLT